MKSQNPSILFGLKRILLEKWKFGRTSLPMPRLGQGGLSPSMATGCLVPPSAFAAMKAMRRISCSALSPMPSSK